MIRNNSLLQCRVARRRQGHTDLRLPLVQSRLRNWLAGATGEKHGLVTGQPLGTSWWIPLLCFVPVNAARSNALFMTTLQFVTPTAVNGKSLKIAEWSMHDDASFEAGSELTDL